MGMDSVLHSSMLSCAPMGERYSLEPRDRRSQDYCCPSARFGGQLLLFSPYDFRTELIQRPEYKDPRGTQNAFQVSQAGVWFRRVQIGCIRRPHSATGPPAAVDLAF